MSSSTAERQLLFGLLALQNGFITRDQLVAAFGSWSADKRRPLDAILREQGVLDPATHTLLTALVERHLAQHGGDAAASLASLSSIASAREDLEQLRDPELSQGLTYVSAARPADPNETKLRSAGSISMPGLRFQVLREHARGGLGQVWIALDTELHREVAFKEILLKYAHGEEARTRFLREAEITGGLEHPGIVPVYGLGTYDDGRPFYAMKFIKGDSLKDALQQFHARRKERKTNFDSSDFRQLLRRFVDVCNAMQYAHDRGVLHRDLKPGNIMLGQYGETLVVDWGLAKPLGEKSPEAVPSESGEKPLIPRSSLSGSSGETLPGQAVGTPQFMSPEQARGDVEQLGPATDIYALGATLYQILTGTPPFTGDDLGVILQQVQKGQFTAPKQVVPILPKPLDAICCKAMTLRPTDRYPTPQALAKEVEHWLADEPVSAAPDRLTQRAARFARKNRGMVGTGIAALLLIAIGTASGYLREASLRNSLANTNQSLTTALANERTARTAETKAKQQALAEQARAEANEQRALAAEQTAEGNATVARKQTQLALDTLDSVFFDIQRGLANVAGTLPLRRRLLQTVSTRLEQIAAEFSQAGVKDRLAAVAMIETANVLLRLSGTKEELGGSAITAARRLYQQAHEILKPLADAAPEDPQAQRDLSASYSRLGDVTFQAGDLPGARELYEQSLEVAKRLAEGAPKDAQAQHDLSLSYNKLGDVTLQAGDLPGARELYEQSLEVAKRRVKAVPEDAQAQRDLSVSYDNLGDVTLQAGDLPGAREFYEQSLEVAKRLAEGGPEDALAQRDLSVSYNNLGDVTLQAGDLPGAQELYEQSLEVRKRLAVAGPEDAQAQRDLSVSYERLGGMTLQAGDLPGARELYEQSLEVLKHLAEAAPEDVQAQRDLSVSYERLGDVTLQAGDLLRARKLYEQALEVAKRLAEATPDDVQAQRDLSVSYNNLGNVTFQAGDLPDAREFYEQALRIDRRLAEAAPADSLAQRDLSVSYEKLGNVKREAGDQPGAQELFEQSLEVRKRLAEAAPNDAQAQRDLSVSYSKLGDVTRQAGDLQGARELYGQTLMINKPLAEAAPKDAQAQRDLMVSFYKLGEMTRTQMFDFKAAEEEYRRGLAVLEAFVARTGLKPFEGEMRILNQNLSLCETMSRGVLDLATLEAQPAETIPSLLHQRGRALAHYAHSPVAALPAAVREQWSGDYWRRDLLEEAARTAEALRKRDNGKYLAGCGVGLCLKALEKIAADPAMAAEFGTDEAIAAAQKSWTALALECLTALVADGYDNFEEMSQAADLEPLRDLPEVQALLKQMREKAGAK